MSRPVVSHTLTPMLNDTEVLFLVDRFLELSMEDPVLSPFYKKANRTRLRTMICRFICQMFGGMPYDSENMKEAHKKLRIRHYHYDAFLGVMEEAMKTEMNGRKLVPNDMKNNALINAESLRAEIVWKENEPPKIIKELEHYQGKNPKVTEELRNGHSASERIIYYPANDDLHINHVTYDECRETKKTIPRQPSGKLRRGPVAEKCVQS